MKNISTEHRIFRLDTNELSITILLHVKICKKFKSIKSSFFFFVEKVEIKYVQRRIIRLIFFFVSSKQFYIFLKIC